MKKLYYFVILFIIALFVVWNSMTDDKSGIVVTNFDECVAQGVNTVMESYPRQCRTLNDETFVEDIGNELEKLDRIMIAMPRPNQSIRSPLAIEGQARGTWFFEGDFPIRIVDENGQEIGLSFARAIGEWMTEEFVLFAGVIEFDEPVTATGKLILEKDNPSGLPQYADQLYIPIRFDTE